MILVHHILHVYFVLQFLNNFIFSLIQFSLYCSSLLYLLLQILLCTFLLKSNIISTSASQIFQRCQSTLYQSTPSHFTYHDCPIVQFHVFYTHSFYTCTHQNEHYYFFIQSVFIQISHFAYQFPGSPFFLVFRLFFQGGLIFHFLNQNFSTFLQGDFIGSQFLFFIYQNTFL